MDGRFVALLLACCVAVLSALGLVLARRLVHCACLLLVHSLAIAVVYLALSADFLAMAQVTVYSGAIVVLFLFVVLLLPEAGKEQPMGARHLALGFCAGGVMLTGLTLAATELLTSKAAEPPDSGELTVAALARSLFGAQLVPFELTAILLLVAMIGAVALWARQNGSA
jgi:NADH-quinone oxidoreductase subunit J